MKKNRALCVNEYFAFKAVENEPLKGTYNRFNSLVIKCKSFGIGRTKEENNIRFLQSLNYEWIPLTLSLQTTLDLDNWSLSDLFGTLMS